MKTARRIICMILIAVMLFLNHSVVFAAGETGEATAFPASDSPMIGNTTDSSKLPAYGQLTDIYGQTSNENADVIDSLISDEAKDDFSAALDVISDFEPVEDKEVSGVLGKVDSFLSGGGLRAYLKSGNLLMGSQIGLTSNKKDKVQLLGSNSGVSSWVFVVDKDAMSWFVTGPDGRGIANALVTVSYLNESNQRITKSVVATAGNTPGIAVFDKIPEDFFGIVDIQAEGYRSVSILDKKMGVGRHFTVSLEKSQPNEVYIRGVDLAGKDMMNEETKLSLVNLDTENLALKIILTKTGNAQFPSSVEIRSDSRDRTVLNISETSDYPYDSNTKIFTASKRWVEKNAGLFADGDIVNIKYGGESHVLEHVTVEDAVTNPDFGETEVPVTKKKLDGNVSDRLGGSGFLNQTMQMLKVPVSFGMFPDGTMVLMASYDITQLDPNTQYKFSSLFQKSWNPKNTENINDPLEIFQKSFWENTEKVKKGDKILESKRKIKCVSNFNYDFSMSFSLFMRSCYNKETNDNYGCGGIMFSGGITAGITEYFLIPAGPVVVPVYIGFEGHLKINTAVNVNFGMDQPPTGHDQDKEWRYSTDDGVDVNSRIEIIVGLSVFGGVGVKGVLGASATGYVDFDIATVIGKGRDEFGDPHSFIDVLYGLRIEYYLLFYSGTINLDCLNGAKRLADSRGEYDKMLAEAMEEMEFKEVSFAECAENYVPQLYSGEKPRDQMFILQNTGGQLQGNPDIVSVDTSVYPDTQIQFAATRDYTALFRIASNGERTDIYYQRQNRDSGNMYSGIYKVALPEGETRSVSEFVVVPNKTDWNDPKNNNKVYIGAILVDDKAKDEEARIRSTDVCAIVVDLDETYTTSSVIASDPSARGQYLYSAPMPAGREDYCSVAYAATALKEDNGSSVSEIKQLMKVIPSYTNYYLSWGEEGNAAKRSFRNLGSNKIYSTGAIAPSEPSYWTVDTYRSSDKYLVLNGYGANGYYEETLRSNFRFDIEGIVDPASVKEGRVNYNSIVTNWQYLNGCSYFVAGGSVYWMNKKAKGSDPADYEWSVEKVKNGSGIVSVDNRYTMITNNNQSAVYLIGVVGDYDVNVEEGTSEKGSNIAKIYTITTDKNWSTGELTCTLHGPLDLKFAKGDQINCFTAAYNPDDCKASGLTIAYSTPAKNTLRYACNIKMWKQNADKGLLVTDVKIPDYRVIQGQPYIEMNVTVRNYGYGRENPIPYTVHDENNTALMQVINGSDVGQTFYTGDDLYTGDFRVDKICVRPNPDWSVNNEHEIVVDIGGSYKYNGSLDDVVNSVKMEADNTTLTANNTLIGGKHYLSTSIINNTFVGKEMPAVKVVLDYGEKAGRELTFRLPTEDRLLRFSPDDTELTGRVYRFDIDMDSIWEDGLKDGLVGAYVSLVDRNGNQQSNETVYLLNPAEKRSDNPGGNTDPENPAEASYTAVDGAGGRWTKGSGKDYTITIKRGDNDDDWSGHYKRTLIDGKVTDVTVKSGSGTITLKADTLEKLNVGNHTITIEFDDGKAELTLTVSAKSSSDNSGSSDGSGKSNSPKTGDWRELSLWITLMTVGLLGIIAVIRYRKRSLIQ